MRSAQVLWRMIRIESVDFPMAKSSVVFPCFFPSNMRVWWWFLPTCLLNLIWVSCWSCWFFLNLPIEIMSTYVKQDITQQCKSLPALACQPFWISEGLGPSLHADRSQSHRMMQKPAGDLGNPSGFAQRSSAKKRCGKTCGTNGS